MADEDEHVENIEDNDEYQFADLDGLGTEPVDSNSEVSDGGGGGCFLTAWSWTH